MSILSLKNMKMSGHNCQGGSSGDCVICLEIRCWLPHHHLLQCTSILFLQKAKSKTSKGGRKGRREGWAVLDFLDSYSSHQISQFPNVLTNMFPKHLTLSVSFALRSNLVWPMFSTALRFYLVCFGKCCPPFTYIAALKAGTLYFKIEPYILGSFQVSFCLSDGFVA
jgi:hypothetical protein